MNRFARYAFTTLLLALLAPTLAFAQASRTWVSGVGDDANPCSRTAPCKTFAGAISKTVAGGEISVLDPGGYGAVTITKSITLDGDGTLASILVSGTNGIVISAGATDMVIIRNLSFMGMNTGPSAVRILAAGNVIIENCSMYQFTTNTIEVNTSTALNVAVRNTSITGAIVSGAQAGQGVGVSSSGVPVNVSLRDVTIKGGTHGIHAARGNIDISHSIVANATNTGLLADGVSVISSSDNQIFSNNIGLQAQPSGTLRLNGNSVFDNTTNLSCGGSIVSAGDNHYAGAGSVCPPTATMFTQ